ncbi:DUF4272 domain-containing protein [Portibacter lacus]|uniref:DUF4272 domain-containing protein n=1 Tax=Portibacter lacus TaxID=1099794 RepID=A0AA37SM01_9BACT|nr:DUF4272 domain-containing protein [Portibacter lacus]GLR16210.1 hypothetical protein GCM10007940_08250 [Portibacter lacus]
MSNYISTLYAHDASFDLITNEAKKIFPNAEWKYDRQNEFTNASLIMKGGFLKPKKRLKITYRERDQLSFELKDAQCPVTSNLLGMHKMVDSIQTKNKKIQTQLLNKIKTINSEFSIIMEEKSEKEFKILVDRLAAKLDAIVFAQPRTGLMNSLAQSFLDKDLNLILDVNGNSEIEDLPVKISPKYFDSQKEEVPEQIARKNNSELELRKFGIKVNDKLPSIPNTESTVIRSPKEIAERTVALALTNLVAFNNITGDQAIQFANKHEIINLLTPKEIEFLKNPTPEAKNHETWKCEGIWTLCWALGIVPELAFPKDLADLSNIPSDNYPIGSEIKPLEFINKNKTHIDKNLILDANDLYYRMDWACVDARLQEKELTQVHPGVVYERHYALNWLINYRKQDWDNVSTDT